MTMFRLGQPVHVRNADDAPIPGHYELEVRSDTGEALRRFVTDKGRAEILRRLDDGRPDVTAEEVDELTVEPDLGVLLDRMDREAGEGA